MLGVRHVFGLTWPVVLLWSWRRHWRWLSGAQVAWAVARLVLRILVWRRHDRLCHLLSTRERSGGLELARLADNHQDVTYGELKLRVGAPGGVRPAVDRQNQSARARPEPALRQALADQVRRWPEANAAHRHLGDAGHGTDAQ